MTRVRRTRTALLATATFAAVTALSACGGGTTASKDAAGGAKVLKVGLLIPGSISDGGYMESAYNGYESIKKKFDDKVDITYVEKVAPADYQQALVQFASVDDLVISIGGQTDADVRQVAPQFPDVKFVEVGGPPDTLANLAMYDPAQGQIAYAAGALAALTSKTGKVGFVAGIEIPPIVATADAFAKGAKAAKPGVTVLPPQYTGDFSDVAKSKQAALADISAGADVLYQILNEGLQGLVQAAKETDTHLIGGPLPQDCGTGSPYVGSSKSDIGTAAEYAVQEALAGSWKAASVTFDLDNPVNASGMVYCADVPTAVKDKVNAVLKDLASGKVSPS
jgi:basic membrane protein A